jgi:anti-sigma factor RsiW
MPDRDPLEDVELNAFIDDQLDSAGRQAVLDRLAGDPDAAAQVMAHMAAAQALRNAALAAPQSPSADLQRQARSLGRALAVRPYVGWARRAAAMLVLFVAGFALGETDMRPRPAPPPAFVSEALMSHRTALLRAAMISQPETPRYDPAELRAATRITLPPQPSGWRLTDAQVYPSDEGPSIGLSFDTPMGQVSLSAFRTRAVREIAPTLLTAGQGHVAFWQDGDLAFALIGEAPTTYLQATAIRMAEADLPDPAS